MWYYTGSDAAADGNVPDVPLISKDAAGVLLRARIGTVARSIGLCLCSHVYMYYDAMQYWHARSCIYTSAGC